MLVQGATRVVLILGHPVAQVQSPAIFNSRFAEDGNDRVMIPADVEPARLADFFALLRGWRNVDGCVLTIPHKRPALAYVDEATDRARRLDAVNVIRRAPDGRLSADMMDGFGFLTAARTHGFVAAGRSALLVGAGGAGSAIADALAQAGLARLALIDLDPGRLAWLRGMLGATFPDLDLIEPGGTLVGYDLVVNASPSGMAGYAPLPVPEPLLATLEATTLVADVVTEPPLTAFLAAAQRQGCRVQTGAEMAAAQRDVLGTFMGVF